MDKLIEYAEDALKDGYPFEVKGDDLEVVLEALRLLKASEKTADREVKP